MPARHLGHCVRPHPRGRVEVGCYPIQRPNRAAHLRLPIRQSRPPMAPGRFRSAVRRDLARAVIEQKLVFSGLCTRLCSVYMEPKRKRPPPHRQLLRERTRWTGGQCNENCLVIKGLGRGPGGSAARPLVGGYRSIVGAPHRTFVLNRTVASLRRFV